MGRDLYQRYPAAREIFDRADATLGRSITALCFEAPAEELGRTANAQPAIFTTSVACLEAARAAGALPGPAAFVAGHSLGEYAALVAAGAMDFEDGLRVVERRGELTQAAADATPGRMAAVLGLDEATTEAVCNETGAELCNLNAPGQIVIGGPEAAVRRACEAATARGAKRAIVLDVNGAFHTSLMRGAAPGMTEALAAAKLRAPAIPYVPNDRAAALTDPAAIGDELVQQLSHPVRWVQCVEYMAAQGITTFVEIGPGRVLTGLIRRIARDAQLRNINSAEAIAQRSDCSISKARWRW
jgi:[acyl-carrier-protein] S-malonyltransferase